MRLNLLIYTLIYLLPALIWAQNLDKFHVVTVANHLEAPGCFFLLESAKIHGVDLKIAGLGEPYLGNGTKMVRLLELFEKEQWPDDDIVIYTDAFDTMVTARPEVILNQFLSLGAPMVISAEKCNPAGLDPAGSTSFGYPCLGNFGGYVGVLKNFIKEIGFQLSDASDQEVFYPFYRANQGAYVLDTECKLFGTLLWGKESDLECLEDGRLRFTETGQIPSIIHGQGGASDFMVSSYKRISTFKPSTGYRSN